MHYTVLSRKYRPQTLDEIIGQELVVKSIKYCLSNNKIPHAFLFYGIRGVGKTTIARIIARYLCCTSTCICQEESMCPSCLAFENNTQMDVLEIDAASRTGVDDIREIIDACQYVPIIGKYKIFIIDEVHMLSKSAFNALLKTLEEPPEHIKFIFATTEINKIPETVLSRCMIFKLEQVPNEVLSSYLSNIAKLEQYEIDEHTANIISEEAEGSVRDGLSILEQAIMISENNIINAQNVLQMLGAVTEETINSIWKAILDGDSKLAMSIIQSTNGDANKLFMQLQTALYRKIISAASNSNSNLGNLLCLWQILLKQTENIKSAAYPMHILCATVVILAHTVQISNGDLQELSVNKNILDDILNQFPNAEVNEIC